MSKGCGEEVFRRELHAIVNFDYLLISDCAENAAEAKLLMETNGIRRQPSEADLPLRQSTGSWVHENQQTLAVADWAQETRFPEMKKFLGQVGIASTCTLPLATAERKLGVGCRKRASARAVTPCRPWK